MQIVSKRDNLHEMSNPVFWENTKYILSCRLLKFLFPACLALRQQTELITVLALKRMYCSEGMFSFTERQ